MNDAFQAEVAGILELVQGAELSPDCRHTVRWCLDHFPAAFHAFCQTDENRYGEKILNME